MNNANTNEVAKTVRKPLALSWPGLRFSVRTDRQAIDKSIVVAWDGGPATAEVRGIVDAHAGNRVLLLEYPNGVSR